MSRVATMPPRKQQERPPSVDIPAWQEILNGYPQDHPERVKYETRIKEIEENGRRKRT
jgi:hypothetical protein